MEISFIEISILDKTNNKRATPVTHFSFFNQTKIAISLTGIDKSLQACPLKNKRL